MAHLRGRQGRGISQSQRRKKSWINVEGPVIGTDGVIGTNFTPNLNFEIASGPSGNGSGSSFGLVSDAVLDKVPPESTLLRLRGSLNLPKNEIFATHVDTYAVGIGVMETGAALLGAFPNPATPAGGAWDGWMFFRSQQTGALDANASIIDVKAMRKVQSGSSIIIVMGSFRTDSGGLAVSAPSFQGQMNLRALILLP